MHDVKVCYLKVNMVHSGLAGRASLASKQALDKVRRRSARVQSTGPKPQRATILEPMPANMQLFATVQSLSLLRAVHAIRLGEVMF